MTEQEIKEGIALLCNTSIEVQSYYQNDSNVVNALNAISDQNLKKLNEIYGSSTGVILSIRKELIQRLVSEKSLTVEEFQAIIQRHQSENKRGFRAYPTAFSIVFPLITIGHQEMDAFVKRFILEIKVKLDIEELVKEKYVSFQGARQTGSPILWFAVFNKNQKNQSTGLQLFVNVNSGKITYGIYRHADSKYLEGRYEKTSKTFDFNEMITFFDTHKAMIIDDNPIVEPMLSEKIEIGNHAVYKVSMGTGIFSNDEIEEFISNSVVLVHEETAAKGTSKMSQGEAFSSHVKEGDYFYLTNSNGEGAIKLLGRFKGEARYPQGKYGEDSWLERDFELVKESISTDKYKGSNRWWTPDNNSTFIQVSDINEANQILFKPYFNVELIRNKENIMTTIPAQKVPEIVPRNIILYGPPGTGKTYHTIDLAVSLTEGVVDNGKKHTENKEIFDQLKKEGQIEFITFHQNYSYEDFMVGLRPHTEGDALTFKNHTGIFYNLCKAARENYFSSQNNGFTKEPSFEEVFDTFLQPLIEDEKEIEVKMKSEGYSFHITAITEDGQRLNFRKKSGGTGHNFVISTIKAIYEADRIYEKQGMGVYYNPLNEHLKKVAQTLTTTLRTKLKHYVLIIDEINRANISRVFGELITLLEDDKRIGKQHELRITLPNGERDFGIPPNLHVVGTMNTADKSIALVDIALRRRFEFIGKYPNYEPQDDCGYTEGKVHLLKKLNENIYKSKKTADFLIGHAYFMKNESIEMTIKNKVIPLLMEYFNNRTDEVKKIFDGTNWTIEYNIGTYGWDITPKTGEV